MLIQTLTYKSSWSCMLKTKKIKIKKSWNYNYSPYHNFYTLFPSPILFHFPFSTWFASTYPSGSVRPWLGTCLKIICPPCPCLGSCPLKILLPSMTLVLQLPSPIPIFNFWFICPIIHDPLLIRFLSQGSFFSFSVDFKITIAMP